MKKELTLKRIFSIAGALLLGTLGGHYALAASPPGAYCATIPTGCQLLNVEVYPMNPIWAASASNSAEAKSIASIPKVLVIKKYCNNGAFGISYQQIEGPQGFNVFFQASSGYVAPTKEASSAGTGAASGTFSCP